MVIVVVATSVAQGTRASSHDGITLKEALTRARVAMFGSDDEVEEAFEHARLTGPASLFDMRLVGTIELDRHGRYRAEFAGELAQIQGYDGEETWEQSPSGIVRSLEDGNANFQRMLNWYITGYWLSARSGIEYIELSSSGDRDSLGVVIDAGHGATATVHLDTDSWLPTSLVTTQFGRQMEVTIEWERRVGERAIPTSMRVSDDGEPRVSWTLESVEVADQVPSFSKPREPLVVEYDRSIDPALEARRASGGHIWVRPRINGQDVGWFLFDTGANGTVIDTSVADKLGLPSFGRIDSTGIGGSKLSEIRRADSMQLAGVRIADVPLVARDLSHMDRTMGMDVGGYLGIDLLTHGIIEYDERDVEIAFHVPDTYELPRGQWVRMPIHNGKPGVHLEYEGHTGLFVIDTGAPGRMIIGPHVVDRYKLLRNRITKRTSAFGTGGSVAARSGAVDGVLWGGQRFDGVPALFLTEHEGAGADILRDGIVGVDLIRRYVLVFDIAGKRIAYLPHVD